MIAPLELILASTKTELVPEAVKRIFPSANNSKFSSLKRLTLPLIKVPSVRNWI